MYFKEDRSVEMLILFIRSVRCSSTEWIKLPVKNAVIESESRCVLLCLLIWLKVHCSWQRVTKKIPLGNVCGLRLITDNVVKMDFVIFNFIYPEKRLRCYRLFVKHHHIVTLDCSSGESLENVRSTWNWEKFYSNFHRKRSKIRCRETRAKKIKLCKRDRTWKWKKLSKEICCAFGSFVRVCLFEFTID